MRFTKKVSYKLAKPLTTLALVAASFGCSKDEPEDLTPIHDTAYPFNIYVESVDDYIKQVAASADSASVRNVFLLGDGISWGGGFTTTELFDVAINPILNGVSEKNRYKVKGKGPLRYVKMDDKNPETYKQNQADSVRLRNFGFEFQEMFYTSKQY